MNCNILIKYRKIPQILNKISGFWYNQTYKPSYIYNKHENQDYNKMYIGKQ